MLGWFRTQPPGPEAGFGGAGLGVEAKPRPGTAGGGDPGLGAARSPSAPADLARSPGPDLAFGGRGRHGVAARVLPEEEG